MTQNRWLDVPLRERMSLKLERRFYGSISIIRCAGVIVVGDSLAKLEEELRRAMSETDRIVLDLKGVDRIDSTGMGLLVRFLSHIRSKGGDLRLCSPSQFVRKLLAATKLDSVFLVYTSDYNAIASFFVRGAPGEERREPAATILFLDPSEDLCAFARSVLGQHGYEVLTTSSFDDAQLLVQAAQPSVILVGCQTAKLENGTRTGIASRGTECGHGNIAGRFRPESSASCRRGASGSH